MARNFRRFLAKYNTTRLVNALPTKETFIGKLNDCLGVPDYDIYAWEYMRARVLFSTTSKCYNFHQCMLEPMYSRCVNVDNTWRSVRSTRLEDKEERGKWEQNDDSDGRKKLPIFHYHYLTRSEFRVTEQCTF